MTKKLEVLYPPFMLESGGAQAQAHFYLRLCMHSENIPIHH